MRTFFVDSSSASVNVVDNVVEIEFSYQNMPWSEEVEDTEEYTLYYGPINSVPYITKIVVSLEALFTARININIHDVDGDVSSDFNEFVVLLAEV